MYMRIGVDGVIKRWMASVLQLLRFCAVGGLNTTIDVVAFNLFVWMVPTHHLHRLILYNSLAYLIAAVNSFLCNKVWTFQKRSRITSNEVMRFAVLTGLAIICNDLLLGLATSLLAAFSLTGFLLTNAAKIAAIAGTVALSYAGMRFGVFNKGERVATPVPPPAHPHVVIGSRSLSVILPAYNEEEVIADTVKTVLSTIIDWMDDFEILVVNDGSKDRTAEVVASIADVEPRVRLLDHPVNQGYGAALVTGFESATKDLIFFMDSDGQFDFADLARFFPLIEDYDAVLGYREHRQDRWMRKLNAWGWKKLVSFFFGLRVRDVDCAFKLYRADFFRHHTLETRGAMINTEVLYKLARAGYTYVEIPVRHLPRRGGKATGAKVRVIARAFRELSYYARKWHREEQGQVRAYAVQPGREKELLRKVP